MFDVDEEIDSASQVSTEDHALAEGLEIFAVIASGVGAAVGAAMLIEHFTDDTDAREYTPNGTRLTAEILAAYTALEGFFQGDETVSSARRWTTPERLARNRQILLKGWNELTDELSAGFSAMPITWASIQGYWSEFDEREKQAIRDWSPID
jgi:hypothetical protein